MAIDNTYTNRRHGGNSTDISNATLPSAAVASFFLFGRLTMQIRYPVTLKKGAPDVDSEPYPIYGTEDEQEAWCIHHQDDVWGWAIIEGNNNE